VPNQDEHSAAPPTGLRYVLGAVPLSRPRVRDFIRDWHVPPRGAQVPIVEQRPNMRARAAWLRRLADIPSSDGPPAAAVLSIDDPMAHVGYHRTDRFVPREHLADDTYLERNLGGWAALWFGCVGLESPPPDDPLIDALEVIVDYGPRIAASAASADLVADRLAVEFDGGAAALADGAAVLVEWHDRDVQVATRVGHLADAVRGRGPLAGRVPPLLAHDELIEWLYRLELRRRAAIADDRADVERSATQTQRALAEDVGVEIMLKGEYVMGRSRRSTIVLAEGLGVVVKQPACEPEHDIEIGARTWNGARENWPVPENDGRMVTPRGRMSEVVAEQAVARLDRAFGRDVTFSTALGLSVEPWESGPTLYALARQDHEELTARRYDEVLVHQLACEELDVDNPDWHAANFIASGDGLVHVDWGAARLLEPHERTPEAARARLEQVVQLAYSFQDRELAERTEALHERATSDPDHIEHLRHRARELVG
jgi:hypothetical protein